MNPAIDGVRNAAIEAALADLERALCRDRCHVVVSAPAGPARTLLLDALAERLAGSLRVVHVPDAGADGDLCVAILRELGEPPGDDAEASLLGIARRLASQGSALALAASEARSLPAPTLRRLGRLAALGRPGVRLVLISGAEADSDRDAVAEIMARLGVGAVKVVLGAPPPRGRPVSAAAAPERGASGAPALRPAGFAPIRVAGRSARGGQRKVWLAALGLALAVGWVTIQRLDAPAERQSAVPRPALAGPAPHAAAERSPHVARAARPQPRPVAGPPAAAPAPAAPPVPIASLERAAPEVVAALPEIVVAAAPEVDAAAPEVVAAAPEVVAAVLPPPAAPEGAAPDPTPPRVETTEAGASPEPIAPEELAAREAEIAVPTIRVSLNAEPWAHIAVDGRDVGVTPIADLELAVGMHRFRARFPDGRVMERSVRIDALRDRIHFP